MFEKSLVDLIRGMRGHKDHEAEYIQSAIKECRAEIRSQDMDIKATALLKLIYLEMFGYDMTWAAFNVLEVMSSAKLMQKRVGYLAAVQTFRPDTEVLMLAENLLKKDLSSPTIPVLSLPLITLPHIITSSLALSILTDLLPRLSHSQPVVRKKTITALYRLALVYPETLRVAWPKIRDRLLDEQEDASVTAATVNVVCELGWRRPQDFLPLAPRLFELLIDSGNNWMVIKIIKLFAILTPVEPRLVKKLVRPLTNLIQSTSAMSLLYECVNGIIQGGILDGAEAGVNVEEIADLCISKLRGMILLDGDPNLKYVALLAFNKIVETHAELVALQHDVILRCLDDPDVSIRLQALDLATGMVNQENLQNVVDRLMKQLINASTKDRDETAVNAESEENSDLEQKLTVDKRGSDPSSIPNEYRQQIIDRILDMCAANTYARVTDFEWYIETLTQLIRQLPTARADQQSTSTSLGIRIGTTLLDLAVRVKELRPEVVKVAERLVTMSTRSNLFALHQAGAGDIIKSTSWLCGEYSTFLDSPSEIISSLINDESMNFSPATIATITQALPKLVACLVQEAGQSWNVSRSAMMELVLGRVTTFLERLSTHPNLEVQERSVQFLELLKVATEALKSQDHDVALPLLLTRVLPSLVSGSDFNPVAVTAQRKVPLPDDLDLDTAINPQLDTILQDSQSTDADLDLDDDDSFNTFYFEREAVSVPVALSSNYNPHSEIEDDEPTSYQASDSPRTKAKRKAERAANNRDDPFYIASNGTAEADEMSSIIRQNQGELDIDEIPIVDLQIDSSQLTKLHIKERPKKKSRKKFVVTADENVEQDSADQRSASHHDQRLPRTLARSISNTPSSSSVPAMRTGRGLLSVDSSQLETFSLHDNSKSSSQSRLDLETRLAEEAEMAAALKEVERKRLELARQEEEARTHLAEGVNDEGAVVKRKKKKVKKLQDGESVDTGEVVKKLKKKKKRREPVEADEEQQRSEQAGSLVETT